jgi:hypothetical protein
MLVEELDQGEALEQEEVMDQMQVERCWEKTPEEVTTDRQRCLSHS